jgi:hypothetical protein
MKRFSNTKDWEILCPNISKYLELRKPRKASHASQVIDPELNKQDLIEVVRKLCESKDRLEPNSKQFWQRITKGTVRINCVVLLILMGGWLLEGEEGK